MSDVCIKIFSTKAEAELAKTFLQEEGDIESSIVCDDAGGSTAASPAWSGYCLLVQKEDKERAIHLLRTIGGHGIQKPPG